jgi:UDP-glucose 4-epimerase
MRVLVTGGAGFIGSHIATAHLARGDSVLIVDNLYAGCRNSVPEGAQFAEADITDQETMKRLWREFRPEVVSHHAAQIDVRKSVEDPAFDAQVNVLGSLNVISNCLEFGVKKLIFASTGGAIYGETETLPTPEDVSVRPLSLYGTAKYCVEQYLEAFGRLEGLDYTILRYGNVYGPGQRTDGEAGVVAIFAGLMLEDSQPTIFGCGDKTRDYVYVQDVVEAGLAAIEREGTGPYNIGTGIQTSDQQVFDQIAKAVGYDGKPIYAEERKGEIHHSALDCSLARAELDWSARTCFADGIACTVEHIRQSALR